MPPGKESFFSRAMRTFVSKNETEEIGIFYFQAMTKVYGKCHEEIGAFNDTKYIVGMLDRVCLFTCLFIYSMICWFISLFLCFGVFLFVCSFAFLAVYCSRIF